MDTNQNGHCYRIVGEDILYILQNNYIVDGQRYCRMVEIIRTGDHLYNYQYGHIKIVRSNQIKRVKTPTDLNISIT